MFDSERDYIRIDTKLIELNEHSKSHSTLDQDFENPLGVGPRVLIVFENIILCFIYIYYY